MSRMIGGGNYVSLYGCNGRRSDSQGELATGLIQNPTLKPLSPWGDRRCLSWKPGSWGTAAV
ncbi:hypothetical protein [Laspinema palackyanum]|uniref:hypothetical protein n=1 Tax=Laspinema palackyanum TaxID=3231601 RepID=UPI00345DC9F3|nr:hypothetical protein [Laspinema sp. D2c]